MGEQSECCLLLIMDDENWLRLSALHEIICMCVCGGRFSVFTCSGLDSFYIFKLPRTHIYLRTSGSRSPFFSQGKRTNTNTCWVWNSLVNRPFVWLLWKTQKTRTYLQGWHKREYTHDLTVVLRNILQHMSWETGAAVKCWWFNVMLAFWLIVLSVHHGYLRSIWRLSWISLWRSKKYLFLCFSLHHLRSSYNNHKRWKILRM